MLAIGYDYGTTTSWLVTMREDLSLAPPVSMRSALFLRNNGNEMVFGDYALCCEGSTGTFIKSPKQFVIEANWEGFHNQYHCRLQDVVENFTRNLLNEVKAVRLVVNEPIHITVTIPYCYKGLQIRYMRRCLEHLFQACYPSSKIHLLPEPIAAALHYAMSTPIPGGNEERKYIAICDIGGGTTDLAVVFLHRRRVDNNLFDIYFRVEATESDGVLGGDNIDSLLYEQALRGIHQNQLADALYAKLKIIEAKETLSRQKATEVTLTLHDNSRKKIFINQEDMENELRQTACKENNTFYECLRDRFAGLKAKTEKKYSEAGYGCFDWDNVVLLPIGGSMRIPLLRQWFQNFISPKAVLFDLKTESRETYDSVVYGALYYSAVMAQIHSSIRNIRIEGLTCKPISIKFQDNRLHPIVPTNMPDGEYNIDTLRPMHIDSNGIFHISQLCLYLSDETEVGGDEQPDYLLCVNRSFMANGRQAHEIPICVRLTIEHSEIGHAVVFISNIDQNGGNFEKHYSLDDIKQL